MSSSAQGLHSLATIIKRLEAVASRFEDIEVNRGTGHSKRQSASTVTSVGIAETPTASAPPPPPPPPPPLVIDVQSELPRAVTAYDEMIIEGKLKPFLEITKAIAPPPLNEQVDIFAKLLGNLRSVLLQAAACRKPDQKAFTEILSPLYAGVEAIARAKEAARKERNWSNHLTVVADGAPCVGWVAVEPKPAPYVKDIKDTTAYYANRILVDFKEKDSKHAEWVQAFNGLLDEMRRYVAEFHTTGLVWNVHGISVSEYKTSRSQLVTGSPPPPPPPPSGRAPSPAMSTGGVAAVFADLNRGAEVTKGLRKVDKSEMTHKNPALRAGSIVPDSGGIASKKPVKPTKPHALMGKKPAKFALEGNKWVIEYQENESALEVSDTDISQVVNLFGCKNTTVIIKGKVNAVTLVNCTKTSVLVESVVSSISVTKSPSFTLQITGVAPTIQLDSTDSGQIYLSKHCLNVEITTAKCSAINVSLPVEEEEEGVFEEQAVPEMLKTVVQSGKLVTTVLDHTG